MSTSMRALMIGVGFCVAFASAASADTIFFSGELSDYDEPDISVFAATVDYSFNGGTNILTITIHNDTASPKAYTVSELYFNVGPDVTGLSISDNGGFSGAGLSQDEKAPGFGTFDFLFDFQTAKGVGANNGLAAGSSATIQLLVTGSTLDITDFFTGFPDDVPGDKTPAVAAIKFTQGPGDDSVTGVPDDNQTFKPPVPEPASMILFAMGLAGYAVTRIRRKKD